MRTRRARTLAAAAAGLLLAGCTASDATTDGAGGTGLRIATTVAPITSLVASIAGDRATVTGIVPEGVNSHTFEPAPSVAALLSDADMLVLNGLRLEEPTLELAEANMAQDAPVVALGDLAITPDEYVFDFSFPQSEGKPNPHLWTDPTLVARYAALVADALTELDPDGAEVYAANRDAFLADVDSFETAMVAALATVPEEDRRLLTYHDSFAYFARTYGWTVLGAIQVSDFGEPTPKELADLVDQIRATGVPAIFGSEVFPSPVLEQLGEEAGVRYVDTLRDDDLPDEPGDVEHSLLGLLRFDFATIVEALGGDADALEAWQPAATVVDDATYPQ